MINKKYFVLLFFLLGLTIHAQDSLRTNPMWLNLSLGGNSELFGFGLSYNKSLEELSYQISVNGNSKSFMGTDDMVTGYIALGLTEKKDWLLSSLYMGPSLSYGESRNSSDELVPFWGAGLAFNAQAYIMPLPDWLPGIGFGMEILYNLNVMQNESVDYWHLYSIRVGFCLADLHQK